MWKAIRKKNNTYVCENVCIYVAYAKQFLPKQSIRGEVIHSVILRLFNFKTPKQELH